MRWTLAAGRTGTGSAWASKPESARGILARSAFEHSVSRVPEDAGSGWAVVHAGDPLDASVHVALGGSPVGPFSERYVLRLSDCPIEGFDPKAPALVYAVKAHPELSTEDELLISLVLVRAQGSSPGRRLDAGYYVPRFLRLPWDEIIESCSFVARALRHDDHLTCTRRPLIFGDR